MKCTDLKNDVHHITTTPSNQPSSIKHDSRKFSPNQSLSPQATIAQISITVNSSDFELLTDGIIQFTLDVSNFFHSMFLRVMYLAAFISGSFLYFYCPVVFHCRVIYMSIFMAFSLSTKDCRVKYSVLHIAGAQ